VGDGDGMYNQIDPTDSRWVYNNREHGSFCRLDQKTGTRVSITPTPGKDQPPLRFNWTPPIHLSPHNSQIIYIGAQAVFRSLDRGDHWQQISPDLTYNDPQKTSGRGNIKYCTITTISESPRQPGIIWAGTDDGRIWVTRNGGTSWEETTKNLAAAGAPEEYWVTRVLASRFQPGTAYITKTGFHRDIDKPLIFKTTDFGVTWKPLNQGLPETNVNVITEDVKNENLLFAGTNNGVFVTIDGGAWWVRFKSNMPSVQVRDIVVHPRENDLIVATYGRGLYICDISPLQGLNDKILSQDFYLFEIPSIVQHITRNFGNFTLYGDRYINTPNEPEGALITYYLKEKSKDKVKISISDCYGKEIGSFEGTGNAGFNRVVWDMWIKVTTGDPAVAAVTTPVWVSPGEYGVTVQVGNRKLTRKAYIIKRLGWSIGPNSIDVK